MATLPVYELANLDGERVSSPQTEGALICFIKEDCPTCKEVAPVLDAFFRQYGERMPVQVIGQTQAGNAALAAAFAPAFSILDHMRFTFLLPRISKPCRRWFARMPLAPK